MEEIDKEIVSQGLDFTTKKMKAIREDIETEDKISKVNARQSDKMKFVTEREMGKEVVEYDENDRAIVDPNRMLQLSALDHSKIQYENVRRNFYVTPPNHVNLSAEDINILRSSLDIKVSWEKGEAPPVPALSFSDFGFEVSLMRAIKNAGYTNPTPIQSQAVPVALTGRDIIGIAQTGSGKTAAFVWPMLIHIGDQSPLKKNDGPIGIIIAPTRELAAQIYEETKRFAKSYGLKVAGIYGGLSNKKQQITRLKRGVEIVIGTPGRLIDMIKIKALRTNRISYLILDEADRMLDMGFEPQIKSISGRVRPDRQILLFSATFKKKVEVLAKSILRNPVRITVGLRGGANEDVTQIVHVFSDEAMKWPWLACELPDLLAMGSVLIFCTQKSLCEQLATMLNNLEFKCTFLHGDIHQTDRSKVMFAFKNGNIDILIATDVAARGLDIKDIKTVINYQIARDIESHTHRIGRTGRAGEKGIAFTLVTPNDKKLIPALVQNLKDANQEVPDELKKLARGANKSGKRRGGGGGGGGDGGGKYRGKKGAPQVSTGLGYTSAGGQSKTNNNRMTFVKATNATPKMNIIPPAPQQRSNSSKMNFVPANSTSQSGEMKKMNFVSAKSSGSEPPRARDSRWGDSSSQAPKPPTGEPSNNRARDSRWGESSASVPRPPPGELSDNRTRPPQPEISENRARGSRWGNTPPPPPPPPDSKFDSSRARQSRWT